MVMDKLIVISQTRGVTNKGIECALGTKDALHLGAATFGERLGNGDRRRDRGSAEVGRASHSLCFSLHFTA